MNNNNREYSLNAYQTLFRMPNKYYTKEYIELLVNKFTNKTLLKTEWTHESHLIVALWFIHTYEFFDAVCRLKSGIILLNNSQHIENTNNGGYHETLTIFWAKVISIYIKLNEEASIDQIINDFINSPLANKSLPFEFYDKQRLLSSSLRSIYSKEDKKEMDDLTIRMILTEK